MNTLTTVKYKSLFVLLILLISGSPVFANSTPYEESKKYEERFETNSSTQLSIENSRGDIQIIPIDGSEARAEITLKVKGKSIDEIQKIFDHFELLVNKTGNQIEIVTQNNIRSWNISTGGFFSKSTIKFNDRSKAKDIEEINVAVILYLPKIELLSAKNKYSDIIFSELNCDLDVELYSGKLKGNNIDGDLSLEMKYGEVNIGSFKSGSFEIYDCNVTTDEGGKVKIESKYSDLVLGNMEDLSMDSYDDDMILGDVKNNFEIETKYSDVKIGSFASSTMDLYDTDVKGKGGGSLELTSKYGAFDFKSLKEVKLSLYDDDFEVDEISDLTIKESKYSEIEMDEFDGQISITSSYQDKISVLNTITDFKGLDIEAKYTTLRFPISPSVPYFLNANLKYGDIDISDSFENTYTDKSDSKLEIKGMANGASKSDTKITVTAYDSNIKLK